MRDPDLYLGLKCIKPGLKLYFCNRSRPYYISLCLLVSKLLKMFIGSDKIILKKISEFTVKLLESSIFVNDF